MILASWVKQISKIKQTTNVLKNKDNHEESKTLIDTLVEKKNNR